MNTEEKTTILTKFISDLHNLHTNQQTHKFIISPKDFDSYNAPEIDLVTDLISHQNTIHEAVDGAYDSVKGVLEELSELQTRKENITKLLDAMTAAKEVKRLSYGLGSNPQEIYKNLQTYYQIREKVFYCDKYIDRVEEEITKVKANFQSEFEQQLKKSNSGNISEISKTLNLISQFSNDKEKSTTNDHLSKFYVDLIRKEFKTFEEDLFKIPIVGVNTSGCYVFFEIAKEIMKMIVNIISSYRNNILKIGGEESHKEVVVSIFKFAMTGIIYEIFVRQKKYFEIDSSELKKKAKEPSVKFKDYLNEFCAIWNQIQRLENHLSEEIPETSSIHKDYLNGLENCTNTVELINVNSEVIEGIKTYTKAQLNKLLQTSTFVNSIWQINDEFLKKISDNFVKSGKELFESPDAHEFLISTFSIFVATLKKTFESLNMLIISPVISFTNNNLIQEDSFHAFKELFSRMMERLPSNESKYYTAIVIIANTVPLMPNALKTELSALTVPTELENYKIRLESELKELVEVCEYKAKEVTRDFVRDIVSSTWYTTELKQDYKKAIDKWQGLSHEINELFLLKSSDLKASLILEEEFTPNRGQKKLLTQQSIISLEKEVRNVIMFFEVKGCSVLSSFRKVLEYIEVLLSESQEDAESLMEKYGIKNEEAERLTVLFGQKLE